MDPRQQLNAAVFVLVMTCSLTIYLIVYVKNFGNEEMPVVFYENQIKKKDREISENEPSADIVQDALVQFAESCKYDAVIQKVACDSDALQGVLVERSKYPYFKKYDDPINGVHFSYPSSVSRVQKTEDNSDNLKFYIKPINSEFVQGVFWKGITIDLNNCDQECPENLEEYLLSKYPPLVVEIEKIVGIEVIDNETVISTMTATTTKDILTFDTQKYKFADKKWVVGEVSVEGQPVFRVLVTLFENRLVEIYDDTYLQGVDLENAFSEVLNTLAID